jgi:hypothetical protein
MNTGRHRKKLLPARYEKPAEKKKNKDCHALTRLIDHVTQMGVRNASELELSLMRKERVTFKTCTSTSQMDLLVQK